MIRFHDLMFFGYSPLSTVDGLNCFLSKLIVTWCLCVEVARVVSKVIDFHYITTVSTGYAFIIGFVFKTPELGTLSVTISDPSRVGLASSIV